MPMRINRGDRDVGRLRRAAASPVETTLLPAPPAGRAFEPTLAIDPANPDRMVAAAMRGILPHEPSTGIWTWSSIDWWTNLERWSTPDSSGRRRAASS
jgi:hypothetical protein